MLVKELKYDFNEVLQKLKLYLQLNFQLVVALIEWFMYYFKVKEQDIQNHVY